MTLAALQRDFRKSLIDEPAGMGQWVDKGARPGLAIYHNAYRVQLVDCLLETFEKTHLWLGDDAFTEAARTHIESTPPYGWTLGIYGEGFECTLAALYPDDPEVAELAWLDWALSRAFEGQDAPPLDPVTLQDADWDNAVLKLVPTFRLRSACTNAGAIWSALSAESDVPAAAMLPEPGAMLVWRQEFTPCFRTIEAIERDALRLIEAGESFGALCSILIERSGEDAGVTQAGALLGQWIGDGLIAAVETKDG
jgi:hypothetical protein